MNLFDIANIEIELKDLEESTMKDGFWNDSKASGVVLQKIKLLKRKITSFKNIDSEIKNLIELNDLLSIEEDLEMVNDLLRSTKKLSSNIEKFEIEILR